MSSSVADGLAASTTNEVPTASAPPLFEWFGGILLAPLQLARVIRPWAFGGIAFLGYWGVPLILAGLSGALLTADPLTSRADDAGWPIGPLADYLQSRSSMTEGIAYLSDSTHFLFALVISFGTSIAVVVLKNVRPVTQAIISDAINESPEQVGLIYETYRASANHWLPRLICVLLGVATGAAFVYFATAADYAFWWGSTENGVAGFYLAVIEGLMVFYGLQAIYLITAASFMFLRIFRGGIRLRPFHPDGCTGLAPIGRLIVLLWLFAIALGGAIYVALRLGYLGLSEIGVSWMLALVATCGIPVMAAVPLYAALRAAYNARFDMLSRLEPALERSFKEKRGVSVAAPPQHELTEFYSIVKEVKIWPFSEGAVLTVIAAYALQAFATFSSFI